MKIGATNCRATGMIHAASDSIPCVPNVTSAATTWPRRIMSCREDDIMPRSPGGEVSELYIGTTTMVMPVMPKLMKRPMVNWAAVVAEVCRRTPLQEVSFRYMITSKGR